MAVIVFSSYFYSETKTRAVASHLENEQEVLTRLAAGNQSDFNTVYNNYSATVFNTAMIYLRDPVEAQEIVQLVFIKLWESRTRLGEVQSMKDYLFITTKNAVFNFYDRLQRQAKLTDRLNGQQVTVTTPEDSEYSRHWTAIIETLPGQQKIVYQLVEVQDNTLDEVAVKLNLAKPTVKKHLELARKTVREEMRKYLSAMVLWFL